MHRLSSSSFLYSGESVLAVFLDTAIRFFAVVSNSNERMAHHGHFTSR